MEKTTVGFVSHILTLYPNVAKVGGLQSQGAEGEAAINLLQTLGNAGFGVLRPSRRVNNMAYNGPRLKET